jgi:tetratricopeptide (TPR) repeat protein
MSQTTDSTQPSTPLAPKPRRGRGFLLNTLIVLVVIAVTIFAGYQAGISARKQNQAATLNQQLTEQLQYVNDDIQAGKYEVARQRLEFIIANDPSFPGAQEKLTEVLVQINLQEGYQSPTPTASLSPTPDFSGAEQAYARASQLIAAQDWPGAIGALDQLRKLDPNYQQSQVDGMYYFAFRNYGYSLIAQQGNLEGGIYQLTLAERFGPLDRDANGLREGARVYLIGASFWELDWEQAVNYFAQASSWGNLWDGTMTAAERYWFAQMRYGDDLYAKGEFCGDNDALAQYQRAMAYSMLDAVAQTNYDEVLPICYPPTPTIDLTAIAIPSATATLPLPVETPTETPTPTSTP